MATTRGVLAVCASVAAAVVVSQGCSSGSSPAGATNDGGSASDATAPGRFDAFVPMGRDAGDDADACAGLACQQVACSGGKHTTISGTVLDPAGKNPVYDAVVYVPNGTPEKLGAGAACGGCDALYTGHPLVTALTTPEGKFLLQDAPAGSDVPLVIQIGKWRRIIKLPTVVPCVDNPILDASQTRLPKNGMEGDLPQIAVSTGAHDTLECVFARMGLDPSEYVSGAGGSGHLHVFQGTGGRTMAGGSPASDAALWKDAATLSAYDMVVLSCEGAETPSTKPAAALDAMKAYADSGGRVFASHYHYYWLSHGPAPWPDTATWHPSATPGSDLLGDVDGRIAMTFAKGGALFTWLGAVKALQPNQTLRVLQARYNADVDPGTNVGSQPWILPADPAAPPFQTQYFTFDTPYGAPSGDGGGGVCGRVAFDELHVPASTQDFATDPTIPAGCARGDLSPQEKALEFMLFDLASCVIPDTQAPAPPPPGPR